jgi:hypothetical protein
MPVLRCWLRFFAALTAFCMLPVLLIRAQPHDDSDLRAFLTPPDDCPAPCFMGIRPGVTTARETFAILHTHDWVESVWIDNSPVQEDALDYNTSLPSDLSWIWRQDAPDWLNKNVRGWLNFRRGYVSTIVIDTHLRLGDTLLIMGRPDHFAVRIFSTQTEHTFRLTVWYLNTGTVISTGGICPMRKYNLRIPLIFVSGFEQVEAFDTRRTNC